MSERTKLIPVLTFVFFSFALNSIITRVIVSNNWMDPIFLTMVRFISGALMLGVVYSVQQRKIVTLKFNKWNCIATFFLGSYAFAISFGYMFIGAAAGTLVFYGSVILTMTLYSILIEGERPSFLNYLGQALALSGIIIISMGGIHEVSLPGVLLMAVTGISWGIYSALGDKVPSSSRYTSFNFILLSFFLIPWVFVAFSTEIINPSMTQNALVLGLVMGAITTALSYIAWYWSLQRITSRIAGTYQLSVPVIAGFLGIILLNESFSVDLIISGVLVLAGMYLLNTE